MSGGVGAPVPYPRPERGTDRKSLGPLPGDHAVLLTGSIVILCRVRTGATFGRAGSG